MKHRLLSTFLIGFAALFVSEALYTAGAEPLVGIWMVPIHVGVGAPLALAGGWFGSRAFSFWLERFDTDRSPRRVTAWLLAATVLAASWVAAVASASETLWYAIATPEYAAVATALVAALLGVLFGFAAGIVVPLADRILEYAEDSNVVGWMTRPIIWAVSGAIAVTAAIGIGFLLRPDTFWLLPWAYVVGPAVGIACGITAFYLLDIEPSRLAMLNRRMAVALAALGLFSLLLPGPLQEARSSFVDRHNLAGLWQSQVEAVLDFDDDGSLPVYAGGDCAPFDPDRGPHATEVPNDGVDWNCSGSDLTVDLDEFHRGPPETPHPDGVADQPHVILVTTDALSHPHTSVGGYERDVTPNLADWAEHATVFETAFSNSTSTRLAFPGFLASKMNCQMHLEASRSHPYPYADHEETLVTILDDTGYRTVHIPGDDYFVDWDGYRNGIDELITDPQAGAEHDDHTAEEVTDAAVETIENHSDGPLHLWVHYYDHHGPYSIPDDGRVFGDGESDRDRFDSELHFADRHWGRLFEAIERRWEPDEYVVVFTSDHGEAFDDNHQGSHHDFSVFTRALHVPLIIQAPWGRGRRIEGLAGHIDVMPTIANLVDGAGPSDGWDDRLGETLVPALTEGTPPQKSVIYSLFYIPEAIRTDEDRFQMYGVRTDEWYFYENRRRGERRLVRWREDPLDHNNLRDEHPEKFEAYRYVGNQRLDWFEQHEIGLTHLVDE